ncbi:MAG: ABC transporter permease [Flavobacterium sp.]|nr:MAG: ABC transporter permease [Flavobacterium sp.]
MKRLISIELQKIWKNKASRVLTLTYFVLLSFIALIASIKFDIGNLKFHLAEMGIFNFPYIWHFNTYIADFFKFFLAIVIVSMMANEYSYGTLKQNLIDGMSKKEFIQSKFLTVVLFALASTIFVFVMTLILGLCFSSYNEPSIIFSEMEYLVAFFVKLIGFFSLCLFLGILVKRSAFALGFLLVGYFAEWIIYALVRWQFFNEKIADAMAKFFPLNAISNLIVEPITRLSPVRTAQAQIGASQVKDYTVHFSSIAIVLTWTVIFVLSSHFLLKKRDL